MVLWAVGFSFLLIVFNRVRENHRKLKSTTLDICPGLLESIYHESPTFSIEYLNPTFINEFPPAKTVFSKAIWCIRPGISLIFIGGRRVSQITLFTGLSIKAVKEIMLFSCEKSWSV